jgi:4-hydroxy-2-oxoglutarate aldolase
MTQEALVKHYFAVADAASIPVVIYNMPSNSGLDMSAETILAISEHPNIIGLKDSGGNLVKMGQIISQAKEGFQVLAGSAGFLLPALAMGAVGGILALANIAPKQCISIFKAFAEGRLEEARELQQKVIPLNAAVTRKWGVPALKEAMQHCGLYGGPSRKPLLPLTNEQKEIVFELMKDNQLCVN